MAGHKLLYNTGAQLGAPGRPRGVGWGEGEEVQEGGDMCKIMADLHYCMAETNTALKAIILHFKVFLKIVK